MTAQMKIMTVEPTISLNIQHFNTNCVFLPELKSAFENAISHSTLQIHLFTLYVAVLLTASTGASRGSLLSLDCFHRQ